MAVTVALTVAHELTTLDLLLWRHFRHEIAGLVEAVYDLNQGLAAPGAYLPVGTVVTVPLPARQDVQPRRSISLYD